MAVPSDNAIFFTHSVKMCEKAVVCIFFRLSLGSPTFSLSIPRSFGHFSVSTWTPSWQNNLQTRKYYYKNHFKKYVLANTQSEFGSFVLRVSCMKCSEPDENIAWGDIEGPWRVLYELYSLKMPWTKIKKFVEKTEQYPLIIPMSGYWLTLQPNLWSGTESKQNRITNSSQPWPSKNKLSSQAFDFGLFLLFAGGIPFHSSKFSTTTFELMVSGHWTSSIFNLGHP